MVAPNICQAKIWSKRYRNILVWNATITNQPNKYAEIIMPRTTIARQTKFIIDDGGWFVVETDSSSVPGILYLSQTEDKINAVYDDLEADVADLNNQAQYDFIIPEEPQKFYIGDKITPIFTFLKNGLVTEVEPIFSTLTPNIINEELFAIAAGTGEISVKLPMYDKEWRLIINITQNSEEAAFSAYLSGNDNVRVGQTCQYELLGNSEINSAVTFSISDTSLATISEIDGAICRVKGNLKNKLGQVILTAVYNDISYEKVINIKPIW